MPGRKVMRSSAAVDDELTLTRIEPLRDDLRVIPTAAFCDCEKNRFVAWQHFGPSVAALFFALRQGLRCAARGGNLQQSGTGVGCVDDSVVRSPYGTARPRAGV